MLIASSLKRGNGSETATGETPFDDGYPISTIEWVFGVESLNARCFSGSNDGVSSTETESSVSVGLLAEYSA